ncbi:hypothetical protein SAMN05216191_11631 [Paenibacillus jilunlii]|uniref:Uncharacterized protein n=1 Tax=Paenibacillus jilunlii TaxID=682956 RepID=A0A1G9V4H6_9BACL|nr:hypothetical protein SAMN05216191_11631 [Paenibacillus jilunlii]
MPPPGKRRLIPGSTPGLRTEIPLIRKRKKLECPGTPYYSTKKPPQLYFSLEAAFLPYLLFFALHHLFRRVPRIVAEGGQHAVVLFYILHTDAFMQLL